MKWTNAFADALLTGIEDCITEATKPAIHAEGHRTVTKTGDELVVSNQTNHLGEHPLGSFTRLTLGNVSQSRQA